MEKITSNKISLKTIIINHFAYLVKWFILQHPNRKIRDCVFDNICKILACNTWNMWFATFTCNKCWESHKQPFTCKSRFCVCCSKPASDKRYHKFISRRPQHLHTFHLFFTIPEELRRFFCVNRGCKNIALRILSKTASEVLYNFFLEYYKCKVWWVSIIHTFGADCKRNPHIHFLITAWWFCIKNSNKRIMVKDKYLPYNKLQAMWKYQLLTNCRIYGKTNFSTDIYKEFNKIIDFLFSQKNKYWDEKSWFVWVDKKISSFWIVLKYIWRYLKRPVIWESRIEEYDWEFVTFSYKDRQTKEKKNLKLLGHEFLLLICRHIPDKHFKMISYFGIFANRCRKETIAIIKKHNNYKDNNYFVPITFSERSLFYFKTNPLLCKCWWEFLLSSMTFISRFGNKRTINFDTS